MVVSKKEKKKDLMLSIKKRGLTGLISSNVDLRVDPQNKIGHSARRHGRFVQVPVQCACGI